jgi:hypothetical protein
MVVKIEFTGLVNHSEQENIWQCRAEINHKLCSFGRLGIGT